MKKLFLTLSILIFSASFAQESFRIINDGNEYYIPPTRDRLTTSSTPSQRIIVEGDGYYVPPVRNGINEGDAQVLESPKRSNGFYVVNSVKRNSRIVSTANIMFDNFEQTKMSEKYKSPQLVRLEANEPFIVPKGMSVIIFNDDIVESDNIVASYKKGDQSTIFYKYPKNGIVRSKIVTDFMGEISDNKWTPNLSYFNEGRELVLDISMDVLLVEVY